MGGNEDQRHVVRRDYLEAFRLLTERDTQFQRRVYVYVACAFIESETWMMKQMALEKASGAAGMPPDEASACREIRYYVRESGVVASAPAFQSFVPGIRFAFRVAYRWHFPGRVWNEHKHDIGWTELTVADLAAPVALPDQATLEAWHQANADRFTAPEIRKISYV